MTCSRDRPVISTSWVLPTGSFRPPGSSQAETRPEATTPSTRGRGPVQYAGARTAQYTAKLVGTPPAGRVECFWVAAASRKMQRYPEARQPTGLRQLAWRTDGHDHNRRGGHPDGHSLSGGAGHRADHRVREAGLRRGRDESW